METPIDPNALYQLAEFEKRAEERLPADRCTVINGGAGSSKAVRENCVAWDRWALRSRVLRDVSTLDCSQTVLGQRISLPVLVGPSGMHGLLHSEAETATASAAGEAGTIMVLAMNSSLPVEEVAKAGAPFWFQLYWGKDRGFTRAMVERAAAAGCRALCLTVDVPVRPWQSGPTHAAIAACAKASDAAPAHGFSRLVHIAPELEWVHDATLTWKDLDWLRGISPVPIVLKGIMTEADAVSAVEHHADAIVVSNHGGRALEHGLSTADVLPGIVDAVNGRVEVLVDGGIRGGADVFRALALGARAVLVGRPALWGLAVGGKAGVRRVLDILAGELRSVMGMTGAASLSEIQRPLITRRS